MRNNDLFGFYFAGIPAQLVSLFSYGSYSSLGHLNMEAIVAHLKGTWNFSMASQVLLTGSSAGGIGTFNNANWLQSVMPNAVGMAKIISLFLLLLLLLLLIF
jgi:hypothetical protein